MDCSQRCESGGEALTRVTEGQGSSEGQMLLLQHQNPGANVRTDGQSYNHVIQILVS